MRCAFVVVGSNLPRLGVRLVLHRLHLPVLGRFSTIVLGEAIQSAKEQLNIDDTVVGCIQPFPVLGKIFEWVAFFDLVSIPCGAVVSTRMGEEVIISRTLFEAQVQSLEVGNWSQESP